MVIADMSSDPFNLQRFVVAQSPVLNQFAANCGKAGNVATGCGSSFLNSKAWEAAQPRFTLASHLGRKQMHIFNIRFSVPAFGSARDL